MNHIREVEAGDCDLLFAWANDSSARQNSLSTEPIAYESHCSWFQGLLANPQHFAFIWEFEKEPAGLVRFRPTQDNQDLMELSYSLDAKFRGRGLAVLMLDAALEALAARSSAQLITAKVKPGNKASVFSLQRAGYELTTQDDDLLEFQRKVP